MIKQLKNSIIITIAVAILVPMNRYVLADLITPEQNIEAKTANAETIIKPEKKDQPVVKKTMKVTVTAYSSTPDQTDSTPFITANGTHVHDGIIAANFLPFGTKVRFPDYSGDKIYTVEDRMHPRFANRADIWFTTRQQAVVFGKRTLQLEVLE